MKSSAAFQTTDTQLRAAWGCMHGSVDAGRWHACMHAAARTLAVWHHAGYLASIRCSSWLAARASVCCLAKQQYDCVGRPAAGGRRRHHTQVHSTARARAINARGEYTAHLGRPAWSGPDHIRSPPGSYTDGRHHL